MKTWGLLLAGFLFIASCGGSKPPPPPPTPKGDDTGPVAKGDDKPQPPPPPGGEKKLYDRLGGLPAITAVVDEFVNRTTSDPRIKERFFNTDAVQLKKFLTEFVCMATGGPCKYTGRDMATSHAGMDLADDEFTALVENLAGALDKFKVPDKEKNELLGALGPLKPQIVAPADHFKPIDAKKLEAASKAAAGIKDQTAQDLVKLAVVAGGRGQRSYAEQLFTRAEMITGPKPLDGIAGTFRAGAPPRVATAVKTPPPTPLTAQTVGGRKPTTQEAGRGIAPRLDQDDGKAPGLGVVMLWWKRAPEACGRGLSSSAARPSRRT
jgi:hemoglobin